MKTIVRRAVGAVLALGMTVALLSGCGGPDPVKDVMGYSGSTVFFTVNGEDVTAEEYLFWLANQIDANISYLSMMAEEGEDIWDVEVEEGVTVGDSIKDLAQQYAVMYNVVAAKGEENGYTYTEEDKASYQEDLAAAKEQMGGEEAYQQWLKGMCLTEEGFEKMSSVSFINEHMARGMFRDGTENAPTAEDLTQFANDQDLLAAKHILLLTKDMTTGEAYDQAKKDEQKAKAEDLLAQLQAVTDPEQLETKFDELMNANSEDTGLSSNPDGYVFSSGEMVEQFETATRELEPGQISGIVESDYGYHIILRLDPAQVDDVRTQWENNQMSTLSQQWVEEAEIETTEAYDNLSVSDFYDKLTAYRDTLTAEEESTETDSTDATDGTDSSTDGSTDAYGAADDSQTTDGQSDGAQEQSDSADSQGDGTDSQESADSADGEAAQDTDGQQETTDQ